MCNFDIKYILIKYESFGLTRTMKQPKRQKSENFKTVNFQLDEDQQLWNAIKLGDSIALKELFDKYYADLYFYGSKLES